MKTVSYFCVVIVGALFLYNPKPESKTVSVNAFDFNHVRQPELQECDKYRQKIESDLKEIKENINSKK